MMFGRLDVAVDHAGLVRSRERRRDADADVDGELDAPRVALRQVGELAIEAGPPWRTP